MGLFELLAPGVLGYSLEDGGALYVPVIMAVEEGNGDVGRFLDSQVGEAVGVEIFNEMHARQIVDVVER